MSEDSLVEQLADCCPDPNMGLYEDKAILLIRSHTNALIGAAVEACAHLIEERSKDGYAHKATWDQLKSEIRSLVPPAIRSTLASTIREAHIEGARDAYHWHQNEHKDDKELYGVPMPKPEDCTWCRALELREVEVRRDFFLNVGLLSGAAYRAACEEQLAKDCADLDRRREELEGERKDDVRTEQDAKWTAALGFSGILGPETIAKQVAHEKAEARLGTDSIFKWLLGENGEFAPRPDGAGLYWWRTELRQRIADLERRREELEGEKHETKN